MSSISKQLFAPRPQCVFKLHTFEAEHGKPGRDTPPVRLELIASNIHHSYTNLGLSTPLELNFTRGAQG